MNQAGPPYVYTSPSLQNENDRMLRECPVGFILRTTPHIYAMIDVASQSEHTSMMEYARSPRSLQQAVRVVRSEQNRLSDLRQVERESKQAASIGARVRKHGR